MFREMCVHVAYMFNLIISCKSTWRQYIHTCLNIYICTVYRIDTSAHILIFSCNTLYSVYQKIEAVWKLITFTSMLNRIINTSSNEIIILLVYDTCLQMFDVCSLGHTAHIQAIVQFLSHSNQHVRCEGPALFPLQRHPVV